MLLHLAMDGEIHRRRWQHNMLLSIILAIILFLAVVSYSNDIAINTHQQNYSSSISIDKEVYEKERMQFNPKLPIHIQNLILDSRSLYNDTSLLHSTSGVIPSSIRRRRRELLYTTTTNCIESYHVSIVPEEVNTCTNSNYYVSFILSSLVYISILGYHIAIDLHSNLLLTSCAPPYSHNIHTLTASRMVINTTTKVYVPYNINKMLCRNVSTL